ncbi:MAG: hypothetical protein ACREMZ_16165 [Gemmatimonadales bacterium]
MTATQTLAGLQPGTYTVSAQDVVAAGGTPYTATPASQDVSVVAGATATATVTYSPPSSGDLNLKIDGMYLTQSAQTYGGAVPLVQNRNGYLRVFVVANRTNVATTSVRVRFYKNLVLENEVSIPAPGLSVPTAVDESSLSYSWNVPVAGAVIQPGLSIIAEVDPDNAVAESDEGDNAFPAGAPLAMNVRSTPTLSLTFVPVVQAGNGRRGNVSDANTGDFMADAKRMHPLASYDASVHAQYTTTTSDTLQDDNGNNAWVTILNEIDLLRQAEASSRYYYGVVKVSYTSGVAGVAYVSEPANGIHARAALGWDYLPSGSLVAAHELSHNWSRNHAPCGDPGNVDSEYPYADGSIGVYGLDVEAQALKPPSFSDIMGYCDDKWISDYTYSAVLDYLSPPSLLVMGGSSQQPQPSLLVWGYIREGQPVLEPAFLVHTRPSLPRRSGPYTLEAQASDGSTVFALSFSPKEIADAPGNQQNFVFAVPLSSVAASQMSRLSLRGYGREAVLDAKSRPSAGVQLGRLAGERVRLRWDAGAHPMVMVRDPDTGEVLSLARGGDVQLQTSKTTLELVLSDGVKSRITRVPVSQ